MWLLCYCYQPILHRSCRCCCRSAAVVLVFVTAHVVPCVPSLSTCSFVRPQSWVIAAALAHVAVPVLRLAQASAALLHMPHARTQRHVFKMLCVSRLPVRRGSSATAVGARRTAHGTEAQIGTNTSAVTELGRPCNLNAGPARHPHSTPLDW